MKSLDVKYSLLEQSIKRLFSLNDRNLTDDKLGFIVSEIRKMKVPEYSVIKALDELGNQEMPNMKFVHIKRAIQANLNPVENKNNCEYCCSIGLVSMRDERNRAWAFACTCSLGLVRHEQGEFPQWNGNTMQNYRSMKLVLNR